MIPCSIIAQELVKYSPDRFQLILPPVSKSALQNFLFVDLVPDVLLPPDKHSPCAAAVVPQEVVSNLPMGLLDPQIIDVPQSRCLL